MTFRDERIGHEGNIITVLPFSVSFKGKSVTKVSPIRHMLGSLVTIYSGVDVVGEIVLSRQALNMVLNNMQNG